jgi:hypothetical protein
MFRIDDPSAAVSLPTPEAANTEGYFTEGTPGVTPATLVRASFLNMLQEELRAIVTAVGLTPSKTIYNQVLIAIRTIFQRNDPSVSAAGGTSDVITCSYTPAITTLTNGMSLYARITSPNTTTTPTFTPNSGTVAAKTIVKGAGAALSAGDLAGGGHWVELQYDSTLDKWVLLNPATGISSVNSIPAGTLIPFTGTSAPSGFLVCPTSQTNISRTTYAALFAAIGTTWGVGDGSTTFGIPYFPADYTAVQANSNVGTSTVGQVIAHSHPLSTAPNTGVYNTFGSGAGAYSGSSNTGTTGAGANYAAGMRILICVKY